MAISPNSVVHLLNVPLENNYKNQIYFGSKSEQTNYMISKKKFTFEKLTYQRKDNILRVPLHIDRLWEINYVMYQNSDYSNKWFYAFVTKMEYVNDGRTDVYIETDVWQTWFSEVTLKESFVEREHVMSDDVGEHINGEGLQLGDYVCSMHTKAGYDDGKLTIVVGVTKDPDGKMVRGDMYDGIYSGLHYYTFENSFTGIEKLRNWLDSYDGEGASQAVQCMFLAPQKLAPTNGIIQKSSVDKYHINHDESEGVIGDNIYMNAGGIDGYVPRNNKLLSYPYRYLMVSNNNGGSAIYEYEQFYTVNSNEKRVIIDPKFVIEGCLTPGCSIRMIPENYKGVDKNDEEGINLGKYPALNWVSDYYTNWMTQNCVNVGVSVLSDIVQTGIGVAGAVLAPATGGMSAVMGASALAGGVSGISNTLGEIYKASKTPPQSHGNVNCGDVITASNQNDFHFYNMTIKRQYAEIIDKFFDMFGYKVNVVKVPNISGRPSWNYVKTIDCNLDGKAPQEDLTKIRQMFDNGVTFWKNGAIVEDYSQPNLLG